jgi:hypothetical protein
VSSVCPGIGRSEIRWCEPHNPFIISNQ